MSPWLNIVCIGAAAFLVGGVMPISYYWIVLIFQRSLKVSKTSGFTVLAAITLSFGSGAVLLVYLASINSGNSRVIALSAMIGFGFVRLVRGDYRYK
jgi:hypothetical protein